MAVNIPQLFTPEDCLRLSAQLPPAKAVVALCPRGKPPQTVDVMLFFRKELRKRGITVLFLTPENALADLERFVTNEDLDFIYRINSIDILRHCAFINILCTYDIVFQKARTYPIDKIILFPHNMMYEVPGISSFWMDYVVAQNKGYVDFDFSRYPNSVKYFRNRFLTAIPASYPKLNLRDRRPQAARRSPRSAWNSCWSIFNVMPTCPCSRACSFSSWNTILPARDAQSGHCGHGLFPGSARAFSGCRGG